MSTEKHRVVRVINLYKTGDLFICLIFMPKSSKTENIYIKIIKVTKTDYTLDNGDVYEHTFDIDENITVDEFQTLLDNAKNIIVETLTKIENNKL